jgi:dUTP diphosphatase
MMDAHIPALKGRAKINATLRVTRENRNQQTEILRFKKLDDRAVLPSRGSSSSAGLDLCSIEEITLRPNERLVARTGLAVAIPEGYYGRLAPRSGLASKHGLDILAGVVDADYRGEIGCIIYNTSNETVRLPAHTKICQLIIEKIITPAAAWADDLSETDRGEGGFGSTG